MPVPRHDVEGRAARAVRALLRRDLLEAPVRVGAAQLVDGDARERPRLVERATLETRRRAADADPRPLPRDVDVMRERDREARIPVARRLEPELAAQPLERRIERIETR